MNTTDNIAPFYSCGSKIDIGDQMLFFKLDQCAHVFGGDMWCNG